MEEDEARRVAVDAARRARDHLTHAIEMLEGEARMPNPVRPFADYIAAAVRALVAMETETLEGAAQRLDEAMTRLRHILNAMREPAAMVPMLQSATEAVAKSLAILHPARRAVEDERVMAGALDGESRSEPTLGRPVAPPGAERRARRRVTVNANIGFQSDTNFYTGFSGDLSVGGLFLATEEVLPQGTDITVSFLLPDGHHVTADGRVSWVRAADDDGPGGMGISFEHMEGRDLHAVLAFIDRRAPLFVDEDEP